MSERAEDIRLYAVDGQPIQSLVLASASGADEDGLVWRRIFPYGTFSGPIKQGRITITRDDAVEAAENFNAGFPGPMGVPIDERADHTRNPEGSYGWLKRMEVRDDGLWGGYSLTPQGKAKVESGELPYWSPRFWLGKMGGFAHKDWMPVKGTFVQGVALTTSPFFAGQDPMGVAAAAEMTPSNGGTKMTPEEARAKYTELKGEVSDEAWAELIAGVEDFEAFIAEVEAAPSAEPEVEPEPEAEAEAEAEPTPDAEAIAAAERVAELEAQLAATTAERDEALAAREAQVTAAANLEAEVAGVTHERNLAVMRAEVVASVWGGKRLGPAAVEPILGVKLALHEDDRDALVTATAELMSFLDAHGGTLPTYEPGERDAVTATAADGSDDERWLAEKDIPEHVKLAVRGIANQKAIGYKAAYAEWHRSQVR